MTDFSRRHYETIAREICEAQFASASSGVDRETLRHIAYRLSDVFRLDNPKFIGSKFIFACGFGEIE